MTRKQAISKAIDVLVNQGESGETVQLLRDLYEELPLIHWTDKSIRDTVNQFILDNQRVPTVTDFKHKGMPPHPVFKNKYGVSLHEWLEVNYPVPKPTREELKQLYTSQFIEDYYKIKPRSQEEFNKKKGKETKGWQTVASYYGEKSWRNLIKRLGLPLYFELKRDRVKPSIAVNIHNDYDFSD